MTCPSCRQLVEQVRNVKDVAPAPLPKHNAWFVCEECGSISRVIILDGVTMLRLASIDEFADSNADHAITIQARRDVIERIRMQKNNALLRVKARILRRVGKS